MKRLLFIKTGYAIKGIPPELLDFEHWTAAAAGLTAEQCHTVTVIDGEQLPDVHDYRGIVISGSAAMVSDRHPWSEYTAQWLLDAMQHQVPILGICYGHQLLAHALGGVVGVRSRSLRPLVSGLSRKPSSPNPAGRVFQVADGSYQVADGADAASTGAASTGAASLCAPMAGAVAPQAGSTATGAR